MVARLPRLRLLCVAMVCSALCCAQETPDFQRLTQAAAAQRESSKSQEAIRSYDQAVQLRPDYAEGWWYLGTLQYESKIFDRARDAFEKLVALAPDMGAAWNFLGLCEFETHQYSSARTHLEKGLALGSPDDPEIGRVAAYHLALLRTKAGDFDSAENLLSATFPESVTPLQVKVALGLALLHAALLPAEVNPSRDVLVQNAGEAAAVLLRHDDQQAATRLAQLIEENPEIPYLRRAYADVLRRLGKPQEASQQEKLEAALDSSPQAIANQFGNPQAASASPEDAWHSAMADYTSGRFADAAALLAGWVQTHPDNGTAWAVLGLSEFELKDYSSALAHLEKGHALGYGGSQQSVALANYRLGVLLIHSGDFERATAVLASHLENSPMPSDIQFALGMALLRVQKFPDQIPPADVPILRVAGQTAEDLQASRYDDAFLKFNQMLNSAPELPFLHYAYGTALIAISRYEDAEKQMRDEIRISPNSELPYLRLASIAIRQHRPADAFEPARKALALDSSSADAHYLLGRAYLESSQTDDAVRELSAASKFAPNSPEVHFNLAKAYARAKRNDDAARERAIFAQLNQAAEQQRNSSANDSYEGPRQGSDFAETNAVPR